MSTCTHDCPDGCFEDDIEWFAAWRTEHYRTVWAAGTDTEL